MIPSLAKEPEVPEVVPQNRQDITAQSSKALTPSPQFRNVEGTLKEIQGNVYVIGGEATEQSIRVEDC
ncbi:MAG: hypothetical protein VST67_14375 [Nitrospirota bacterium]|nr:hypothetical protein [Nitrospirota bacterium]